MIDCNNKAPQGRVFLMTRKKLVEWFGSPSLVKKMIKADWIPPVRKGKPGREALYDYEEASRAYERFKAGEEPGGVQTGTPEGDRP